MSPEASTALHPSFRVFLTGIILLGAVLLELVLLLALVVYPSWMPTTATWLCLHLLAATVAAVAASLLTHQVLRRDLARRVSLTEYFRAAVLSPEARAFPLLCFSVLLAIAIPFFGGLGAAAALIGGSYFAQLRHRELVYWHFTDNADLPFTSPVGRNSTGIDSRSLTEQVTFSDDSNTLYKKVLAAGRIRTSLSVDTLKHAVRHSDERIRLTAYQTLDKKSSNLNLSIQRLERAAASREGQDKSNTWLQIASYYWELLTLEKDEPIAREQLLAKAANAALTSITIVPTNRNAHFTLGRISLLQKNPDRAAVAFRQAIALGMPREKAIPYLAEAAFAQREFATVSDLLESLDPAFTAYPPLSHVAKYWS